jgi:ATP-dependent DNA helicase RecG
VSFEATDFLTLDLINREEKLPQWARDRMPALLKSGVVERIGRKYMLSRKYYEFVDRKGVYSRKRGLDRETNKLLLLKHIRDNRKNGSRLNDLRQVLPALSRRQVQALIAALKKQNKVWMVGKTSAARWYPHGTSKGQNNE